MPGLKNLAFQDEGMVTAGYAIIDLIDRALSPYLLPLASQVAWRGTRPTVRYEDSSFSSFLATKAFSRADMS